MQYHAFGVAVRPYAGRGARWHQSRFASRTEIARLPLNEGYKFFAEFEHGADSTPEAFSVVNVHEDEP